MKNTADALKSAKIDLEAVIVPKVNVEAVNVPALLLTGNVIQTFVGIVGSVVAMVLLEFLPKGVIIMNVEI